MLSLQCAIVCSNHGRHLLMLCRTHLEHEDTFVHGAMLARRPGSAATTLGDHEHHKWAFVEIENTACAVAESVGAARRTAAQKLYALLARFVADNYEHMHVEETANNPVLWAEYSDAELLAIKGRLLAAIALGGEPGVPALDRAEPVTL